MTKETAVKTVKKKAPLLDFQMYRNGAIFKKIKAVSYEDAKCKGRKMSAQDKYAYFEIKSPSGGIVPL